MATVAARVPASAAATNEKVDDMTEAKERYILANDNAEIVRMTHQHEWMKGSAGGLIKAPINLSQRGLKVLDSATADGKVEDWSPGRNHAVELIFIVSTQEFGSSTSGRAHHLMRD
jgi:hypothetical protein